VFVQCGQQIGYGGLVTGRPAGLGHQIVDDVLPAGRDQLQDSVEVSEPPRPGVREDEVEGGAVVVLQPAPAVAGHEADALVAVELPPSDALHGIVELHAHQLGRLVHPAEQPGGAFAGSTRETGGLGGGPQLRQGGGELGDGGAG
jgi:hypothetical protein